MPRTPKAIVLDTWAVVAFLESEPAGPEVAEIIASAQERGTPLMMSTINVGEVWYNMARAASESQADQAVKELRELGIEFIDPDWPLTRAAAAFKAKHRTGPERSRGLSYADCFAAALAKERKAELVTGDKEFKAVEADVKLNFLV